jgi:hypothetical protein
MNHGSNAIEFIERYRISNPKNRKLEYALVTTYRELGMIKKFQELSAELYVTNDDVRYYRLLKENITDAAWTSIKKIILEKIKTLSPSPNFIARFYENEGMIDDLIMLLEEEANLRHIMKYDYSLYKTHYIDLERIYKKAIKQYLDNHVGDIATRFIDEILHHLTQIRAHKLETSLKSYISSQFPHRLLFSSFS